MSKLGIPSNGIGSGGGIGSGSGGGVGSGKGPGVGPGSGGGFGGGAFRIGGGVSAPSVLSKVEPEYSEEARKAKWQGTVVLSLVVDDQGRPQNLKVLRSLGLGLDQKAIEGGEVALQAGHERRQTRAGDGHHRSKLPATVKTSDNFK